MVESYERGTKVVLVKNPNYWEQGSRRSAAALSGQGGAAVCAGHQCARSRPAERRLRCRRHRPLQPSQGGEETPDITLEVAEIFRLDYVYLNHKQKPLDDKRIRLAMNHAANLEAIKKVVFFDYGELPNSINPKMNFWSPDVPCLPTTSTRPRRWSPRPAMTARRSSC